MARASEQVNVCCRIGCRVVRSLLEDHARFRRLRTLDALQLGAVIQIGKATLIDHFVCADKHLLTVAQLEGIPLINPEDV
jgi:hypothetical protein